MLSQCCFGKGTDETDISATIGPQTDSGREIGILLGATVRRDSPDAPFVIRLPLVP
jgi:hypothetical protein